MFPTAGMLGTGCRGGGRGIDQAFRLVFLEVENCESLEFATPVDW